MAEASDKHSKTEEPTSKRLDKSREDSPPPMSQMLTSSLTLLAGIVSLYIFGSFMMDGLKQSTIKILSTMGDFQLTESNLYVLVLKLFATVVMLLAPLIVTIIATAVVSSLIQDNGRLEFRLSRLKVDFTKLSPVSYTHLRAHETDSYLVC